MKTILKQFFAFTVYFVPGLLSAQDMQPILKIPFTVSEGSSQIMLEIGIDSLATDLIDKIFGEEELPPLPPAGIFDARLTGTSIGINLGNGTRKDFRSAKDAANTSIIYQLSFQKGSGSNIIISWELPQNVKGTLQDFFNGVVVNQNLSGGGNCQLTNPNITDLKITITYNDLTSFDDNSMVQHQYKLKQNYPNPFNSSTIVEFEINKSEDVIISVYNLLGEKLGEIVNNWFEAGIHNIEYNSGFLPSGIYIYTIKAGTYLESKKMIVLK